MSHHQWATTVVGNLANTDGGWQQEHLGQCPAWGGQGGEEQQQGGGKIVLVQQQVIVKTKQSTGAGIEAETIRMMIAVSEV